MKKIINLVAALIAIVLNVFGIYYFFTGFLPQKLTVNLKSSWNSIQKNSFETQNARVPVNPKFDRLIIMVVDALRNLLKEGKAIGFTANAKVPTVTLPRIKALMTGTIPNYIDAVTNLLEQDSDSTSQQDSIIWQLVNNSNKTIHMFGDDTWLRLFPNSFAHYEGTTSFYVSDTVQVDLNVTRNLDSAFDFSPDNEKSNWDVLILHYLGLDHIGHLEGPKSRLMPSKQREMDGIVEKIYTKIKENDLKKSSNKQSKPSLLVLLGDHGMNEIGNHGGSSIGETSPAMIFISPSLDFPPNSQSALTIDQTDLVPTLSFLLGFPIPQNNVGIPIFDIFSKYSEIDQLKIYELCALSINNLVPKNKNYNNLDDCKNPISEFDKLQCFFLSLRNQHSLDLIHRKATNELIERYKTYLTRAQTLISQKFGGYDLPKMCIGAIFIFISVLFLIYYGFYKLIFLGSPSQKRDSHFLTRSLSYVSLIILASISHFSTSLIEEEHFMWFYLTQTLLLFKFLFLISSQSTSPNMDKIIVFLLMVSVRISKSWNNLGIKWQGQTISVRNIIYSFPIFTNWILFSLSTITTISIACAVYYIYGYKFSLLIESDSPSSTTSKIPQTRQIKKKDVHPSNRKSQPLSVELKSGPDSQKSQDGISLFIQKLSRSTWFFLIFCVFVYKTEPLLNLSKLDLSPVYSMNPQPGRTNRFFEIFLVVYRTLRIMAPVKMVEVAQLSYVLFFVSMILNLVQYKARSKLGSVPQSFNALSLLFIDILFSLTPIMLLLSKPHNSFLFILMYFVLLSNYQLVDPSKNILIPTNITILFCIAKSFYFAFGNTNSLASFDLSSAYTGLTSDFNIPKFIYNSIALQNTILSNFAPLIFFYFAIFAVSASSFASFHRDNDSSKLPTSNMSSTRRKLVIDVALFILGTDLVLLLSLFASTIVLRSHLFIWSVFAPKVLYAIALNVTDLAFCLIAFAISLFI
ncbi:GPI ethanolamine phosphate transferase 2 [Smittium mucronatum]|uniref:GPI ethanolamine phosphate transferase 2 n=1 Tax=Smittium mucronatum TaxID=133383 RepID=A0A1R0GYJ3_9FUNG|nr:GPI ethanolamine phosphate transferase 2 [Smittium mucronatum]